MQEKLFPSLKEGKNCKIFLMLFPDQNPQLYLGQTKIVSQHLFAQILPNMQHYSDHWYRYNMNNNPKNNILVSENIRQKRLTILEYFDAYICHHYTMTNMCIEIFHNCYNLCCLIFSDTKMLFFGLLFILYYYCLYSSIARKK